MNVPTTAIEIPLGWKNFISASFNRIYINPASGCRANCGYCYIFEYGHGRKAKILQAHSREIVSWLTNQEGFRKGKYGTLISIGSSCDPFSQEDVSRKTVELVKYLAPLENPIQIASKYSTPTWAVHALHDSQVHDGQIVIFNSITSFAKWKRLEPGADPPEKRIENLMGIQDTGINTCLYIKPFIPGVTNEETETLRLMITT